MFQPTWVVFVFQGTKTPSLFRLQCSAQPGLLSVGQKWAKMLHDPCILGGPQQRGQDHSTKKQQKAKIKKFHCVPHPTYKHGDCQPRELTQRPSHHRGIVHPLDYKPSLTDVSTEMVLIFGPIWFSSIVEFS